jgi:hypothetical protein
MLFWTVAFLTFYLTCLIKGNIFHDAQIKAGEYKIEKAEAQELGKTEIIIKEIDDKYKENNWFYILIVPLFIVFLVYIFKAFEIDIYKYPTTIILAIFILNVIFVKSIKMPDLSTKENRDKYKIILYQSKKYTFKSFIINLFYLTYFIYMFYLLVF